jgi:hypothetical protein
LSSNASAGVRIRPYELRKRIVSYAMPLSSLTDPLT